MTDGTLYVCGRLLGPVPNGGVAYVLTGLFLDAVTATQWARLSGADFLGTVAAGTLLPGLGEVGVATVQMRETA